MIEFNKLFNGVYKNKRVLVTGHTGFKGSWLTLWLSKLGAIVHGFSIDVPTQPAHYELLNLKIEETFGNVSDYKTLKTCIDHFKPVIIFHLAAQSLVRKSYQNPVQTIETNVMGTAHVLMAVKESDSVEALVNVTSDKCYENKEWVWGYRENDSMGGYDPYSASKGCAELIHSAFQRSFFLNSGKLIASCRAGNVIGGGDWADDRILPDLFKSVPQNRPTMIRNPHATRPWQHVLEPISGYLLLGQMLLEKKQSFAQSWNFGPDTSCVYSVMDVVKTCQKYWNSVRVELDTSKHPHEAQWLHLDCSKAYHILKWWPVWNFEQSIERTVNWYRDFYEKSKINSETDLEMYITEAANKKLSWANCNF
jgi:CDP-glucose 4,6-dehydratase